MLSSSSPRSTPRTSRASHSAISFSRPSSQSTIIAPASPPSTPPDGRRPSFPNSMPWLSRTSTQSTRISEPKLVRSIELVSQQRSGVLGTGATVVRTPDEALRETRVRLTFDAKGRNPELVAASRKSSDSRRSKSSDARLTEKRPLVDTPTSPPLPPLPMSEEDDQELLDHQPAEPPKAPPRPIRAPPPTPAHAPSLRSSLKSKSTASDDSSQVPPLPANISASPPPPPFRPILISEVPTGAVDPSKIIVTLDTCTATYRTTLDTIGSRPSHLSSYLSSLFFAPERASVSSSIYSTASDDVSVYRHHLTSQGLLSQASFSIQLFLDRPSAPYAHILTYLRSPVGTPDAPEILPRSVQLQSSSHSRLEQLLELRDEAAYLNLEGLHKLCTDEIRLRHRDVARLHHVRGQSSTSTVSVSSIQSLRASVYGLHTLLERVENDARSGQQDSSSIDSKGSKDGSPSDTVPPRSLATPQSWNGPTLRGRSESKRRDSPSRSPPVGWL